MVLSKRTMIACLVAMFMILATANVVRADNDVITVGYDDEEEYDYESISEALDEAEDGATIEVGPGEYAGFTVNVDDITLRSSDEGAAVIEEQVQIRGAGVTLQGFEFAGDGDLEESESLVDVRGDVEGKEFTLEDNYLVDARTGVNARSANITATGNTFENLVAGIGGIGTGGTTPEVDLQDNTFIDVYGCIDIGKEGADFAPDGIQAVIDENDFKELQDGQVAVNYFPDSVSFGPEGNYLVRADEYHGQDAAGQVIGDAIERADEGDTVEVYTGTYVETITIDVPDLTLQAVGDAAETVIDADEEDIAVRVQSGLGEIEVNGFTVQNWTVGGIVQPMAENEGTAVHARNNVVAAAADGPTAHGNSIQVSGDGSRVTDNEVEVVGYDFESDDSPTGILVIGADDVEVEGNHVYGADEQERAGNGIAVGGDGSDEKDDHGWAVDEAVDNVIRANTVEHLARGIVAWGDARDTEISGNWISDNDVGIQSAAREDRGTPTGTRARDNNIAGNDMGVEVIADGDAEREEYLDAKDNWWGCEDGPSGDLEDPEEQVTADGDGDGVGDNVLFYPWLGEEKEVEEEPETGEVVADVRPASINVRSRGVFMVTVEMEDGSRIAEGNHRVSLNGLDADRVQHAAFRLIAHFEREQLVDDLDGEEGSHELNVTVEIDDETYAVETSVELMVPGPPHAPADSGDEDEDEEDGDGTEDDEGPSGHVPPGHEDGHPGGGRGRQ